MPIFEDWFGKKTETKGSWSGGNADKERKAWKAKQKKQAKAGGGKTVGFWESIFGSDKNDKKGGWF
jgi:hypothetical protein